MGKTKALINPMMGTKANRTESWYQIKAKADTAEVYIYDEIGYWGVTAKQFSSDFARLGNVRDINLHIHSPGGDVFDGLAIYNLIKNHPATVTVFIDGLAASMASVIAMAGDKVIMPENAMMMIHKPWGIQGGDAEDMRKYAELLDKIEDTLIPAYANKTGKSTEELAEMLTQETWLNGQECVEQGFADELAKPLQAMASINSKCIEDMNMPEILQKMMEPKGSTKTPNQGTPEQPAVANSGVTEPQVVPVDNTAKVLAQQAERINGIKAVFAPFKDQFTDLQVECLGDLTISPEQAKDKLLAKLGENTTPSGQAHIHTSNGNLVGDSVKAALLARTHNADAEKDNAYNNMTLRELARASLVDRGISIIATNPMQMVGMAFTHTSSDFGQILIDVAHKSVLKGWQEATENFDQFTTKGSLSDFRISKRVGLGNFGDLPMVKEGAEYTYATLSDTGAQVQLATYGQLFSITRQAIINDDMSFLSTIPMKLGKAARATIASLVFAQLMNNVKMVDGKALFSADHKNIITGGGIDVDTIDKAIQLMNGQKNFDDTLLTIEPDVLLTPTSLFTKTRQVIGSASVEGADVNSGIINPIRDVVPVLKSQRLQAKSAKDWYLINKEAIEVSYLNGVENPYIDQQTGFTVDGVTTKVRIDAGVNVLDHRGLVRVTNA